ncbi:MAG: lytic transglycosylase domain-containing protein [Smithella sp.]|nr:lytic transglycosylase domain-containing protein [Smithella sp.]
MITGRKTGRLTRAVLAAVVFLSVCAAVPAYADIFKYEDEEGVLHITNVPSNPSAKYVLIMKEKRVQFPKNIDFRKYDKIIARVARENNLEAALIKAVIRAESNFDHRAVSHKGAKGLMQLMPQTASSLNVEDVFHPDHNIEGGARYLRYLMNLYRGDMRLALAAYNAGEGAVAKYGDVPPYRETQNYVQRVMIFYDEFKKS